MTPFVAMLLYTSGAAACIPLGAVLARIPRFRPQWVESEFKHFVMAFGGGVLVAAVALVLIPQGAASVHAPVAASALFLAGGILFFALERWLARRKSESPFLLAALLDYIPESLALGGAFAVGSDSAPLLALLIGLQNIPEGFNAYRERCKARKASPARALLELVLLVPFGPALAAAGWLFLATYTNVLGAIMLAASGGILYLVFQDIAPDSRIKAHWFPPLGAVCGFGFALLGKLVLGA